MNLECSIPHKQAQRLPYQHERKRYQRQRSLTDLVKQVTAGISLDDIKVVFTDLEETPHMEVCVGDLLSDRSFLESVFGNTTSALYRNMSTICRSYQSSEIVQDGSTGSTSTIINY